MLSALQHKRSFSQGCRVFLQGAWHHLSIPGSHAKTHGACQRQCLDVASQDLPSHMAPVTGPLVPSLDHCKALSCSGTHSKLTAWWQPSNMQVPTVRRKIPGTRSPENGKQIREDDSGSSPDNISHQSINSLSAYMTFRILISELQIQKIQFS